MSKGIEERINDCIEEYKAGLLAVATNSGRAKLEAWQASLAKRDELEKLVEALKSQA
jgi:hypothetical protein